MGNRGRGESGISVLTRAVKGVGGILGENGVEDVF